MSVRSSFVAVAELCMETARRWSTQRVNRSLPLKGLSMNIRAASLFVAFAFAALPAHAQRPIKSLNARVAALEAAVAAETAARRATDTTLQNNIDTEFTDRAAADTTLQGQVAKLEGDIVASDLAGTYSFMVLDSSMIARHDGPPIIPATINTSVFRATLTLNADGTGNLSAITCEGSTLTQGTWALNGFDCSEPASDVTWTYADGVITITFLSDGDEIPFNVALGGRLLILAGAPFHPRDPSSELTMFIFTRLR